jgi:hypothetical protein
MNSHIMFINIISVVKRTPLIFLLGGLGGFCFLAKGALVVMISFEAAYSAWMEEHIKANNGERLRRLKEGHGHAEKLFLENVWWPAFGHFHHLVPEYEVHDFKDGHRYLDFAYIRGGFRVCIEIDGYGPHWRDASRWQFADQLMRQNHLIIDGWKVLRFAYDDILEKPRRCQQIVQQLLGRWLGEGETGAELSAEEKEIVRLALRKNEPLTPCDVGAQLGICNKYARKLLRLLVMKKILSPASGSNRIRSYRLRTERCEFLL